ncbi:hypothetical protein MC885_014518 [Smutsia gigantea]|nr:hypothetical protein MC885_014518 [Smutsia gigantea]
MAFARAVCNTSCSLFSDSSRAELPRHCTPSTSAKLCTGLTDQDREEAGEVIRPVVPSGHHNALLDIVLCGAE